MLSSESSKETDDEMGDQNIKPTTSHTSNGGNNSWRTVKLAEINANSESTKHSTLKRKIVECSKTHFEIPRSGETTTQLKQDNKKICKGNISDAEEKPVTSSSLTDTAIMQNGIDRGAEIDGKIKEEAKNSIETAETEPSSSHTAQPRVSSSCITLDAVVKSEPDSDDINDPQPSSSGMAIKTDAADVSSTTSRESCKYGIRCYRRNHVHRQEQAHPGDSDYQRPSYPSPPKGTPNCPYGNSCYRRNPVHFQQFTHPQDTNFRQNYKNYRLRLRQRQLLNISGNSSELDEYDLEDPFIDDSGSDYVPTDEDDDGDDDDDDVHAHLNGDDEDLDYDECDKAEE